MSNDNVLNITEQNPQWATPVSHTGARKCSKWLTKSQSKPFITEMGVTGLFKKISFAHKFGTIIWEISFRSDNLLIMIYDINIIAFASGCIGGTCPQDVSFNSGVFYKASADFRAFLWSLISYPCFWVWLDMENKTAQRSQNSDSGTWITVGSESPSHFQCGILLIHLCGSRNDTQKSWGRWGALRKRNLLGLVSQLLQVSFGSCRGASRWCRAQRSQFSSHRGSNKALKDSAESWRDPGLEQEGSRSQQGAWREQRLLPLLQQKAKLPSARAVPKPLQLPHLLLWAFYMEEMNCPTWYQ